ncbi:MAG: DNA primase [Planctomycetota bacterium]|nr:DNA primase [Gemmataceae bacterium]
MDNDRVKMVKEASDIVDVIGSYISLRPAGQQTFKGLCPFHDDHRPSFDVDPKRGRYRCWSCGKYGDVITFVQEYEKVEFAEALEILAKRAGINLEKSENLVQNRLRGSMLDSVRWASDQYHQCLQESPLAAEARSYLSSRGLEDEIIRQFGLGFAPRRGDWLLELAHNDGVDVGMLEQVGLIGRKTDKPGLYDRFRDRIMFPIRNVLGNTVGFGGRIMPSSPFVDKAPKYYNSSDSPLFSKSEQLYGIDQARNAIGKVGYLAVVEGYTDVMMAHQMGVGNIVATMGTAINARHLRQLRRWTSKVVLVFDADAGGEQGVDRALELFVTNDMDLAIATLPEGLDPCDMLLNDGPEAFQEVLKGAVDALEFKLSSILAEISRDGASVETKRKATDSILSVLARIPVESSPSSQLKMQLMLGRIGKRLGLSEETLKNRVNELRPKTESRKVDTNTINTTEESRRAKPVPEEKELVEVLLANPDLVLRARQDLSIDDMNHPGLRQIVSILFDLQDEKQTPDLDAVRARMGDSPIGSRLLDLADQGRRNPEPMAWYGNILERFNERKVKPVVRILQDQLHAENDHEAAIELLRKLQSRSVGSGSVPTPSRLDGGH